MLRNKYYWNLIIAVVVGVVLVDVFSYLVSQYVVMNGGAFLLYSPPRVQQSEYEAYLKNRDPVLGWPTKDALSSDRHDSSGSRPVPAFPEVGDECVTLYGDSFTYGSEVSDHEAWGNRLASQIECRVGNFGVGAYGTDQSLLRFLGNSMDMAAVSVLGIFPHDIMRNVTQYFYLQAPGRRSKLRFKPRYVVDGDGLRLIPIPNPSFADLQLFDERLDDLLPYEGFRPGNGIGAVPGGFPYTLTLIKMLLHKRVINWLLGLPSWQDFLDKDHPTKAWQVTVGILTKFNDECEKRSKKCFAVFFPTPSSYSLYIEDGRTYFSTIFEKLEELGIKYLDLTPFLANRLGQRSLCEILSDPESCGGHFNAEGNKIIADIVTEYISLNELLQDSAGASRP